MRSCVYCGQLYCLVFSDVRNKFLQLHLESINQSINTFITRHGTEARATVRIMPKQREMKDGEFCCENWKPFVRSYL